MAVPDWKALVERGDDPSAVNAALLRKAFTADKIESVGAASERTLSFVITTGSVDREKDTIAPDGWAVDNFLKNPVVLWAHDYRQLPVGRATTLGRTETGLRSTAQFVERDLSPFADTVYQLLLQGYLRSTSVGFAPTKWVFNEDRHGVDFMAQELLEYSIVPVPANPEALMEAGAKGLDLAPIKLWAEATLDGMQGPGLWLPRAQVERVFSMLSTSTTSTPAPVVIDAARTPKAPSPGPAECPAGDCPRDATTGDGACPRGTDCPMMGHAPAQGKTGRVLSRENETELRAAATDLQGATERIGKVLAKVESAPDAEEPTPAAEEGRSRREPPALILELIEERADEVILTLIDDHADVFQMEDLQAALADVVGAEVRRRFNRLTGRLD